MSRAVPPPVLPSHEDSELARAALQALAAALPAVMPPGSASVEIALTGAPRGTRAIRLPAGAVTLLQRALDLMAEGHGVRLLAQHAQMSTGEAAQALGISRVHFVHLLKKGEIPFHKVGSHRRVLYGDVLAFKDRLEAASAQAPRPPAAGTTHS